MNPEQTMMIEEMLRRRAGQQPSTAGIDANASNSLSPANPLAQDGVNAMSNPPQPSMPQGGASGTPTAGAVGGLKKQKGEASTILNALTQRLRRLPPEQQL